MAQDKIIMLLRGIPGAGKTTWLKDVGANPRCVVSSDIVRIELNGFEKDDDGHPRISQKDPGRVWAEVGRRICSLCEEEEPLVILDATNIKRKDMRNAARKAIRAGYSPVVVDFTDVTLEQAKARNIGREGFRRVPDAAIERMHAQLSQNPVPDGFAVLTRDEARRIFEARQG